MCTTLSATKNRSLLKFLRGLFSRSPMSAKPEFSAVPSTAIIRENRVRKREVVYFSDHSTVVKEMCIRDRVKAEAISRKK